MSSPTRRLALAVNALLRKAMTCCGQSISGKPRLVGPLIIARLLLVDTENQRLYRNYDLKRRIALQNDYRDWLQRKLTRLQAGGFSVSLNGNGTAKQELATQQRDRRAAASDRHRS